MMAPQVVLAYNGGRPELAGMILRRVRDWLKGAGYDRALGVNLYRSDATFMRAGRRLGKPRRYGSLIEFAF